MGWGLEKLERYDEDCVSGISETSLGPLGGTRHGGASCGLTTWELEAGVQDYPLAK